MPANVRHRNLNTSGTEFRIDEEQSDDDEVAHVAEDIGYVLFDGSTTTL